MTKLKTAFALLAMTALSACNIVVSDTPWFDNASGPQLKDGLWANLDGLGCQVGPGTPLAKWPECAQPMMIRGNSYAGPPAGSSPEQAAARTDPAKWQVISHVLVAGDPQVDQIFIDLSKASSNDGIDRSKAKSFYFYVAVKPVAADSAGKITETLRWPVMCGPLPKNGKGKDGKPSFETDQPFEGLTVVQSKCTANDLAALRNAAAKSEGVARAAGFAIVSSRWISDGAQ